MMPCSAEATIASTAYAAAAQGPVSAAASSGLITMAVMTAY
ncbi:hypothetical protein [Frankia sp. AgB32]|nr:hypothetical protein [Frankia sp. AgB32]